MKKHINKISTIQKAAAGIGGAVVVLASATDFFAGNYLVNYAIGRGGDGGTSCAFAKAAESEDDRTEIPCRERG